MGLLGSIGKFAGGAIGSFFGGSTGAAIGSTIGEGAGDFISGAANSAVSYHYDIKQAKELAQYNMELQKELNEYNAVNRYPWAVKSLREAGLNPVLAATQGAPLSGGSVQAQAINAKRGQDVINTAMALGQLDNMREQNKNLQAQNDFIKAQTLGAAQSARQIGEVADSLKRLNDLMDKHPEIFLGQETAKMGRQGLGFALLDFARNNLPSTSVIRSFLSRLPGGYND